MSKPKHLPIALTQRQQSLGFTYLILSLFLLPLVFNAANAALGRPLNSAWLNFVYYCMNFACLTAIFRDYLTRCFALACKKIGKVLLYALGGFGVYYVTSLALTWLIHRIDPNFSNINDANLSGQISGNFFIMAVGTALLVPTAEELMHRALVFGSLHKSSRLGAYMVSAALFAAVHVMGYVGLYAPLTLALCLVQYLPAGLILAWCYEKTGTVFTPILIHTAVNVMGLVALR